MEDAKTFHRHVRRALRAAGAGALIAAASLVGFATKAADTDVMEKKPEGTKPVLWDIYTSGWCPTELSAPCGVARQGHVGMLVGTVEAANEKEAVEKAPAKFKRYGQQLMAAPHYDDRP